VRIEVRGVLAVGEELAAIKRFCDAHNWAPTRLDARKRVTRAAF
jgi:hypothetical protein